MLSPLGRFMQPTAQPPCCLVPSQPPLACVRSRLISLRFALRAAFGRQCWFASPRDVSPFGLLMQPTAQPPCCLVPSQRPLACDLRCATVASLLRLPTLGYTVDSVLRFAPVASFAPAHVALRAAFGRLPSQRPLACVQVSGFSSPPSAISASPREALSRAVARLKTLPDLRFFPR